MAHKNMWVCVDQMAGSFCGMFLISHSNYSEAQLVKSQLSRLLPLKYRLFHLVFNTNQFV